MKIRKKLILVVASIGLLSAVPSISLAEENNASGGWTEENGYWSNVVNSEFETYSSPDNHVGWKESNGKEYRAVGETDWKGKRHYTRAQMINRITGYVYADSDRVWGTDRTVAKSPWTDNWRAITFWGS